MTKNGLWQTSSLGDVTSIISRGISPKYIESGGIKVINQRCIRGHKVDDLFSRRHDASIKSINENKMVQLWDVLVNSTGVGTLGRVAQVDEIQEPTTVDSHVTIVRPQSGLFYEPFFGLALTKIEADIEQLGRGAVGQIELPRAALAEMKISYPTSKVDQQKIVDKIEELFSVIDVNVNEIEKLIIETETYRASWLEKLFSNNLPSSKLVTFPDLFDLSQNGVSKRSGTSGVNTIVIRLADIGDQKLDLSNTRSILLDQNEIEKYKLSENDLLCIRVNGSTNLVGRMILCNRLNGDIAFCDHFIRFRLKQPYLAQWVQMYMNTSKMRKFVQLNKVSSAGQNTISQSTLARIRMPLPERNIVEKAYLEYEEISSKVVYLINSLQMAKIKANQLKQSILKQAFEGKLV